MSGLEHLVWLPGISRVNAVPGSGVLELTWRFVHVMKQWYGARWCCHDVVRRGQTVAVVESSG